VVIEPPFDVSDTSLWVDELLPDGQVRRMEAIDP
jgi:hypothetical protein